MNDKKPNQLRSFLVMAYYSFKAQTRNPATFFFGFIFPIVFISIFGLIGNSPQTVKIGIPNDSKNNPVVTVLKKQPFVTVEQNDKSTLDNELKTGKIQAVLVTTTISSSSKPHYILSIITSSANPQEATSVFLFIRGISDQLNLKLSGIYDPPIAVKREEVSGRSIRYIDFALPGQIGFSLLSTAIFGTVFGLIYLKKALILKRMFATPTKAMTILLSQATSRLIVALFQTVLILLIGVLVFKFYLPHGIVTFFQLILLSTFGLIAFLGFGYLIAGLTNDENAASPLTNLVTLPQFLLSGTFFSTDVLPSWIQPIANNLPLSYFNTAVRKITTEGGNLQDTLPYLFGLFVWSLIMYLLAAKTFKWQ